ncbi:MAG: rane protease FtsH catalytic subunit [Proteobacteria bacterium]|nr:rane protease FtsH catalytic subunit [Pseudomonadota bacterium]
MLLDGTTISKLPCPTSSAARNASFSQVSSTSPMSRSTKVVVDAFDRTHALLQANRDVLERCAPELLARETLDENAIRALTGDLRRWTPKA